MRRLQAPCRVIVMVATLFFLVACLCPSPVIGAEEFEGIITRKHNRAQRAHANIAQKHPRNDTENHADEIESETKSSRKSKVNTPKKTGSFTKSTSQIRLYQSQSNSSTLYASPSIASPTGTQRITETKTAATRTKTSTLSQSVSHSQSKKTTTLSRSQSRSKSKGPSKSMSKTTISTFSQSMSHSQSPKKTKTLSRKQSRSKSKRLSKSMSKTTISTFSQSMSHSQSPKKTKTQSRKQSRSISRQKVTKSRRQTSSYLKTQSRSRTPGYVNTQQTSAPSYILAVVAFGGVFGGCFYLFRKYAPESLESNTSRSRASEHSRRRSRRTADYELEPLNRDDDYEDSFV